MAKYYAVHFSGNWADEMDVESLVICKEKEMKKYQEGISSLKNYVEKNDEYSMCIGTNEDLYFESGDDVEESFWINELDIDDATYKKT